MTVTITEAKARLEVPIEQVQKGAPVVITKYGKPVAVLSSHEPLPSTSVDFTPANRLRHLLAETGREAESKGLTDEILDRLLEDES